MLLPYSLVKNSPFSSCAGPLKSVSSVSVTGLVVAWLPAVYSTSPALLKRVGLLGIPFPKDRPAIHLHQRQLHLGGLLIKQGMEAEGRNLVSREPTC